MAPLTKAQLRRLTVDERLHLMEELWASLEPEDTPLLSDAFRTELDQRLDHPDPRPSVDWTTLRDELQSL
jgi:putative addiction module component (TIGR02574 family)